MNTITKTFNSIKLHMRDLKNILFTEPFIILLIVVGIAAITFSSASLTGKFFTRESNRALQPMDSIYAQYRNLLIQNSQLPDSVSNLLLKKAAIIELKKQHHKYVFSKVYTNYYATVTIFPFLSGILVILTFLVGQKGWHNCSNKLKAAFLTVALLTSLYGLFPTIYQQNDTINQNIQNYSRLNKIQKQIFDYSITYPYLYSDSLGIKTFINRVNQQELELDNLYFGLEFKSLDKSILNGLNDLVVMRIEKAHYFIYQRIVSLLSKKSLLIILSVLSNPELYSCLVSI